MEQARQNGGLEDIPEPFRRYAETGADGMNGGRGGMHEGSAERSGAAEDMLFLMLVFLVFYGWNA